MRREFRQLPGLVLFRMRLLTMHLAILVLIAKALLADFTVERIDASVRHHVPVVLVKRVREYRHDTFLDSRTLPGLYDILRAIINC